MHAINNPEEAGEAKQAAINVTMYNPINAITPIMAIICFPLFMVKSFLKTG